MNKDISRLDRKIDEQEIQIKKVYKETNDQLHEIGEKQALL